jgi:hypothetical protein
MKEFATCFLLKTEVLSRSDITYRLVQISNCMYQNGYCVVETSSCHSQSLQLNYALKGHISFIMKTYLAPLTRSGESQECNLASVS